MNIEITRFSGVVDVIRVLQEKMQRLQEEDPDQEERKVRQREEELEQVQEKIETFGVDSKKEVVELSETLEKVRKDLLHRIGKVSNGGANSSYNDTLIKSEVVRIEHQDTDRFRHHDELISKLEAHKLDKEVMSDVTTALELSTRANKQCDDLFQTFSSQMRALQRNSDESQEFLTEMKQKLPEIAMKVDMDRLYDTFGAPKGAMTFIKTICLSCDKQIGETKPLHGVIPASPQPLQTHKPEAYFSGNKMRGGKASPRVLRGQAGERPKTVPTGCNTPTPWANSTFPEDGLMADFPVVKHYKLPGEGENVDQDEDITMIDSNEYAQSNHSEVTTPLIDSRPSTSHTRPGTSHTAMTMGSSSLEGGQREVVRVNESSPRLNASVVVFEEVDSESRRYSAGMAPTITHSAFQVHRINSFEY